MPLKTFLSGILVDLASHYTALKSFEILHASSNNCLLIRKLSLMEFSCTEYRFWEFTFRFSYFITSFMCLNFSKFANCYETRWNFTQMTESVFVEEKTYFGLPRTHLTALSDSSWFYLCASPDLSQWHIGWFGNSLYCIKIIWNFACIVE